MINQKIGKGDNMNTNAIATLSDISVQVMREIDNKEAKIKILQQFVSTKIKSSMGFLFIIWTIVYTRC